MESEIRIIKLERETLCVNDGKLEENKESNLQKSVSDEDTKYYFATDYFDALTVTKRYLNTPLATIMSIENEEERSGRKTSVQSYTVYYSQKMWEKYEKNQAENHQENVRRGDPFEQEDASLRYLSIIQVHITPEILRRTTYGDKELWDENCIILEPFIDDLYDVVEQYRKNQYGDNFVYRVYQVLSAGDLAVVVKSRFPETSYRISSAIRGRVVEENRELSESFCWTLYKTYTLFAIEYAADLYSKEDAERKTSEKFVVRGCYSCKYWGEKVAEPTDDKGKIKDSIYGLNGRYDFSMDLTMEEFAMLYPIIQNYKGKFSGTSLAMKKDGVAEAKPDAIGESDKVSYLKGLLEQSHLSYINERYLLETVEADADDVHTSSRISLDNRNCETLSKINESYVNGLLETFRQVKSETIRLRDAHKNLEQYFELMKRQILSCRTINQVSDTRVYVQEIGKLLEIALGAIDIYRQTIMEEKNIAMIDMMVKDIKDVVHMLDSYTEYIRNNNLQSLQTPNYNIESSMSMEKILIGYNEYLRRFITAYLKVFREKGKGGRKDSEKEYFPVVIPDLHYMDISVKVLFAEGFGIDWKEEQKKRKGKNSYLMIVESPTLKELGDMPVFMALLFHEMAHQFRYISREERNTTLLDMIVDRYVYIIANNMAEKICWDICAVEVQTELWRMLKNGLKEAVHSEIKDYFNHNKEKWSAPLIYFEDEVIGLLDDLSKSWNYQMDIEENTRYFIKSLQKNENLCRESQFKYLAKMKELLEKESNNNIIQTDDEWEETREKLVRYAFVIAGLAACNSLQVDDVGEMDWIFDETAVEVWVDKPAEEVLYMELWGNLEISLKEAAADSYKSDKIEWIKAAFDNLCRYYSEPTKERGCKYYFKCTKRILEKVYGKSCELWKEIERNYADIILGEKEGSKGKTAEIYRSWSLVGRYLGIDREMEENRKKCIKILRDDSFAVVSKRSLRQSVDVYREVTADMFMYTVMEMTPFTYLNLISSIIPTANLKGTNLERIITVLYIMTSKDDAGADAKYYYAEMDSMWDEFIGYCEGVLCEDGKKDDDYSDLIGALKEQGKKEYIEKRTNADFDTLIKIIVAAVKNKKEKQSALIHIRKLCDLLQSIASQEKRFIGLLEEEKVVRDDYLCGKKEWKKLLNEINNHLNPSDKLIQSLLKLSEESKEHLKGKHYEVGTVNDKKLNEDGIKFLLRSYYSQKIKDSRMEKEKRDED